MRVMIGNDSTLACDTKCPSIPIIIQGYTFSVELFQLPLGGANIVHGVQWLKTLGPVTTDYSLLTMSFTYMDQPVSLRADIPLTPSQRRPNKLNAWPKPIVSQPYTSLPVCLTQPTLSHHKHPILLSTPTLPWTIFFSDISPFSRNPTTFHPHAPSPTIYTYFHKRPWSTSDLTDTYTVTSQFS